MASAQTQDNGGAWARVARALQTQQMPTPPPPAASIDGPPLADGQRVLFRFHAPADTTKVYLAGSFNNWANNSNGKVTDARFVMQSAGQGYWYQWVPAQPQAQQYKFVVEDRNGRQQWLADPHGTATDKDGNSIFSPAAPPPTTQKPRSLTPEELKRFKPLPSPQDKAGSVRQRIAVQAAKVWVRPDQPNTLLVTLAPQQARSGARLTVQVSTPFGAVVYTDSQVARSGANRLPIPPLKQEGGYTAQVNLVQAGRTVARGKTVLSVARNVADDLRYGFYASYAQVSGDYPARADQLARLHINAVEFYDYFPAHGYYAPRQPEYRFEPFGTKINARDIQNKINAGHERNILSLAYVAAYAASESVYRQHPYPMTDASGVPKVFNSEIMTEAEADRQKKPKWFWIMNVAGDSPWHDYITGELKRALDDKPDDLVSFDGFEIDTYGDSPDARFYAKGSKRNGDLLRDVLHDYVGDVQTLTHETKPYGLVSFNSVNEFAVSRMYDVTDFLFLEIWHFYRNHLDDLVNICFDNRAHRQQRVILKIYPADMQPGHKAWPAPALRRTLAATMTGAGSLMVVGEPDSKTGMMHGLNTLYYPDHQPLAPGSADVLRDYYTYDALLYGYTHGRGVVNTDLANPVSGCVTRTYSVPAKHALIVQLLHTGPDIRWDTDVPQPPALVNQDVRLTLPGGVAPRAVFYASPDTPCLQTPIRLPFQIVGGKARVVLPQLHVHGTMILQYAP